MYRLTAALRKDRRLRLLVTALLAVAAGSGSGLDAQVKTPPGPSEIRGRFVDLKQRPLSEVTVLLGQCAKEQDGSNRFFGAQINGSWATTRTDAEGRFVFTGAAAGKYCLRLQSRSGESSTQVKDPKGEVLEFVLGETVKLDLGDLPVDY
jgi:hypothetical protein